MKPDNLNSNQAPATECQPRSPVTQGKQRHHGIATVEFALVVPVLIFLMFGIVQFGWLLNNYAKIANATASAARFFASRVGSPTAKAETWTNFYDSMGGMDNVITRANLSMVTAVAGVACTDATSPTCGDALTTASKVVIASGGGNWADQRATVAVTWDIAGDPKRAIFGQASTWVGLGNLVPTQRVFTASERVIVAQ